MHYSSRFFLYAPIGVLLLIAAVVALWWYAAERDLDRRLRASNGHEIAPGVTLHYADKAVGGFLVELDAAMSDAALQARARNGPLALTSQILAMHSLIYAPHHQLFEAAGTQTLSWIGSDRAQHSLHFVPGAMRASAIEDKDGLDRFDLDIQQLKSAQFSAQRLQLHFRRDPLGNAIDFVLDGERVKLVPMLVSGLGDTIQHFHADGKLSPATPLNALLEGKTDWRAAVENWRLNRGILTGQMQIAWAPVSAEGSMRITLDSARAPAGDLTLSVAGADKVAVPADPRLFSGRLAAALARAHERSTTFVLGQSAISLAPGQPFGSLDPLY